MRPFEIPAIEQASTAEIEKLQVDKLRETLLYVQQHSAFYKQTFATAGFDPDQLASLKDLQQLPTVDKDLLQQRFDDFVCVPRQKVIEYAATSGTMGEPVTFPLTENDLQRLTYNEAISLVGAGVKSDDVVQLMTTIDRRFMAGLAYFMGLRELGCGIIRVGSGVPQMQLDTILKLKPTVLFAVPSFILRLVELALQQGIDLNQTSVRLIVCIGEAVRTEDFSLNTLGTKITTAWNVQLASTYASTEMATAFTECCCGQGGHHHPELIVCEFLDDNDQSVREGEIGELVITTLGVEGLPLVRFRTGDLVQFHGGLCACGRNTLRLGPIVGRKKQMIKYKGTTLYPPAIFDVLDHLPEVKSYLVELHQNEIGTDEILIKAHCLSVDAGVEHAIKDHMRSKLRVLPRVEFKSAEEMRVLKFPEQLRKELKFLDLR